MENPRLLYNGTNIIRYEFPIIFYECYSILLQKEWIECIE